MAAQKLRDRMGGNMPTPPAKVNRHVVDNPPNSAGGLWDSSLGGGQWLRVHQGCPVDRLRRARLC